jgi:glucokinase
MDLLLGVDIGATSIRAAVGTPSLDIRGRAEGSTDSDAPVAERLAGVVRTACDRAGVDPAAIDAAGIAAVGPFDAETGRADPANVGGAIDPVASLGETLATDRIVLCNDATAGAVGERALADAATDNMVYLTISTGIGAGIVVDGSVLSGHAGNAGEVGHVTVDPAGTMTCGCGGAGHWEAYCSGANIPRYARHLAAETGIETTLPGEEFDARAVFARAGEDNLADLVIERVACWNAIGVATLVQAYAPSYVAVGGAVARNNPDSVIAPLRERVPGRVTVPVPAIERTGVGADVVLLGALLSARDRQPDG